MSWAERDTRLDYHRRYYQANKDQWRAKRSSWTADRKRRQAVYMRDYQLRRNYGITSSEYDRMLLDQGGCCALCGNKPKGKIALHVDHCHKTGKVRKLLCVKCNMALGWFELNTQKVLEYLEEESHRG
jgi:hypothetical protein